MSIELEFNLGRDNKPCIRIKHRDKSDFLEQKILKIFIDAIKENGCKLVHTGSFAKIGDNESSFESYEIQVDTPR